MKQLILLVLTIFFINPGFIEAKHKAIYKIVNVVNGGTIRGTIKSSIVIEDPVLPVNVIPKGNSGETELERKTCGDSQQADIYILSPKNEVKNALVIVEGIRSGKSAPREDITIDNIKCRFEPLMSISYIGSNHINKNSDPIFHNANLGKEQRKGVRRTVYNLALPFKNHTVIKENRIRGLLDIKCNAHPWMRAYVYSSDHPYVAITDERGRFEIRDLLPGKYQIRIWHEGFEDLTTEIEVSSGEISVVNESFIKTRIPPFLGIQSFHKFR